MRKIILLMLALSLIAAPALATTSSCPGNEVVNGDFQTGALTPWVGDFNVQTYPPSGNSWAQRLGDTEMYQVFVEPDWNPLYNQKLWSASFKLAGSDPELDQKATGSISLTFYYSSDLGASAPTFTPNGGGAGWTLLASGTLLGESRPFVNGEPDWTTFMFSNFLLDFQPRWLAAEVINSGDWKGAVDDVCFQGQCVPLPGAVLLLGAGLFRLVAYRRRHQD